mgnify:CR=1 FL=1
MTFNDKQQREIFHFLFLERLLKISDPYLYALKGGVNLRFFFNSPRYSEDMDLDIFKVNVTTLKKNGYKILEDAAFLRTLQAYGIEGLKINDPEKAKHTETTQRFRLKLVTSGGEEFPTRVEFSRRTKKEDKQLSSETIPPQVTQPYQRLSIQCQHYKGKMAAVQKLQALAGRAETQARDVFDLHILYLAGHLDKKQIKDETNSKERSDALSALNSLDYDAYNGQVVEYLEGDAKERFGNKKVWGEMRRQIEEVLS